MDARGVTTILLKVVGLIIFSYAIFDIPSYFLSPYDGRAPTPLPQQFVQAVVALLLPIVFGLLLWFFPGTVANRIVSGPKSADTFGAREFERVALTVLGAWLVTYGAVELLSSLLNIYFASRDHPGIPMPGRAYVGPLTALFKVAVGIVLVVGTPAIQRAIERVRGQP